MELVKLKIYLTTKQGKLRVSGGVIDIFKFSYVQARSDNQTN